MNAIKKKIKAIIFGIINWKFVVEEDKRVNKLKFGKKQLRKKRKKKYNNKKLNLNKDLNNKKEFKLQNKYKYKMSNPFFNLITTNNNSYFDKKDNYLNPSKNEKRKSKLTPKNHYLDNTNNRKFKFMNKSINFNTKNELYQKQSIIQKTREIMAYNDEELNQLSYNLALQFDKRTFCEYYTSLIKTKHNLIFSFFYSKDYNSRIIKIDLFFIDFIINFAINTLFFDDNTMHKLYQDNGKFDLKYYIPQIIYSTIISYALTSLLNLFGLSEDYILPLKHSNINRNLDKRKVVLLKKLRILFLLFFIISSIFLLLFWYYISMFCAIYKNTQIHLIKDTLISFGISMVYPFGICLIPGCFRIPALSNKIKNRKCLYNISKIIQFFLFF